MSLQSKIAESHSGLKRKLRDYMIKISGDEFKVIRIKVTEDKYEDETVEVIDDDVIDVILDMPADIPIDRLRTTVGSEFVTTTDNVFLFDILPIIGFARFEDNVEKGDFLIQKVYDEDDETNSTNYTLILRVSEILGNFSHGRISGRRFQCAPHNMTLPAAVQTIINNYNASS